MIKHNRLTSILLLLFIFQNLFFLNENRAEDSKPDREEGRFPFPIIIDADAGMSNRFPNRVQDQNTGMWYRFVPGGEYKIGSDQLEDSKEIKVELSSFYISETCVSVGQISKYLIHSLKHSMDEEGFTMDRKLSWMHNEIKQLPESQQQDYLLYFQMTEYYFNISLYWGDFFKLTPSLNEELEKQISLVGSEEYRKDMSEKEIMRAFKLSPLQRTVFKRVLSSLITHLSKLQSNKSPYGEAYSAKATRYAEYCHANLPTEAQWEVAAQLSMAGKLKVKNMLGDHLEWCSDFYSYYYFQRKHDFKDPTGPRISKLSEKQLDAEVPVSGLKIITRIISRRLGVLRGETVSARHYGILHLLPPANF